MHLLIDENIPQGREVFSAYGKVTTFHGRKLTAADVRDSGADALLVRSITKVNRELLEGSRVQFVGTATIGVDHIDQDYLKEQRIGFSAAPGCNARSVAEYFVAALLHLNGRHGLELRGKTVGVVGYGNVGKQVAAIAPALGLNVLLCDPPLADAGTVPPTGEFLTLRELSARADIVTLHAPLTRSGPHPTLNMVGRELFASWDTPKVLMNMGRGEVIDEAALFAAQDSGKIRRLVLDVFPGEPRVNLELIRRCDLATPHIAGYSIQGKLNGTTQIHTAFLAHFGLEASAAVTYPVPEEPEIRPAGRNLDTVEAALRFCVRHAYDLARDDANLRACLDHSEFSTSFDGLRKTYPVRHEFAGFTVTGIPPEKKSLFQNFTRLDFSVN